MVMANNSTNSMRSSDMYDVFLVLLTSLVQKIVPIGYCISIITTCPLVEYFTSPTSNIQLIRAVRKIFQEDSMRLKSGVH